MKASEMYVKSGTPSVYIKYKGVWDMQDLYEGMTDWLRRRKYKFREHILRHKHPSPFGVERRYVWEAWRNENDYIQIRYQTYMHTYDAHDIEVITPEGDKKIFTKGRIKIEIKYFVVTDYEKRWDEHSFYKNLKDFYSKYVIHKNYTQGFNPKHRYEMFELATMIKNKLKMLFKNN